MILKGKAKEDFEKWLRKNELINEFTLLPWIKDKNLGIQFYGLPFSMQYGVIVDWFDSVGIEILISKDYDYENNIDINAYIFHIDNHESNDFKSYPTRTQARQKAIERANTIYNERD